MPAHSTFTDEVGDEICQRIARGESLRRMCEQPRDDFMPGRQTVLDWLNENEAFRAKYARAREAQADYLDDEMQEIADAATPEDVQVARLRVATRQWRASKLAPKKYGDKLELAGDPSRPLVTSITRRIIRPERAEDA